MWHAANRVRVIKEIDNGSENNEKKIGRSEEDLIYGQFP